jgi:hypothetical protein
MSEARAQELHPGLWQGEWPPPGRWLADRGFSTLVLCAMEYQPPYTFPDQVAMFVGMREANPWPGVEVIYAPLNDDERAQVVKPPRETLRAALRAGRVVAARLAQKRKVLVTCWQGRNRSGLVSALGLYLHLGISGEAATRIVQTRRTKGLRNPIFCEMMRNLQRPEHHTLTGQDHRAKAVLTDPAALKAHLQRIAALGAHQAGFTLPAGVL